MADKDRETVPAWNGFEETWPGYLEDVEWFYWSTPAKSRHLVASRLARKLSGAAKNALKGLSPKDFTGRDGVAKLLRTLQARIGDLPVPDLANKLDEFVFRLRRRQGESMQEWGLRSLESYRQLCQALDRVRGKPAKLGDFDDSAFGDIGWETEDDEDWDEGDPRWTKRPQWRGKFHGKSGYEDAAQDEGIWGDWGEDDFSDHWSEPMRSQHSQQSHQSSKSQKLKQQQTKTQTTQEREEGEYTDELGAPVDEGFLPTEVRGWLLLRNSGLSHTERAAVIASTSGVLRFEMIYRALRSQFPPKDLRQHDQRRQASGKRYPTAHMADVWDGDMPWDGQDEGWDQEDWAASFEEAGYDTIHEGYQAGTWEGDGVDDDVEQDDETAQALDLAQASLQQARQAIQKAKLTRGFKGKGSKGFKGSPKGKGFPKGKGKGKPGKSYQVGPCFSCGGPHKQADCPDKHAPPAQRTPGARSVEEVDPSAGLAFCFMAEAVKDGAETVEKEARREGEQEEESEKDPLGGSREEQVLYTGPGPAARLLGSPAVKEEPRDDLKDLPDFDADDKSNPGEEEEEEPAEKAAEAPEPEETVVLAIRSDDNDKPYVCVQMVVKLDYTVGEVFRNIKKEFHKARIFDADRYILYGVAFSHRIPTWGQTLRSLGLTPRKVPWIIRPMFCKRSTTPANAEKMAFMESCPDSGEISAATELSQAEALQEDSLWSSEHPDMVALALKIKESRAAAAKAKLASTIQAARTGKGSKGKEGSKGTWKGSGKGKEGSKGSKSTGSKGSEHPKDWKSKDWSSKDWHSKSWDDQESSWGEKPAWEPRQKSWGWTPRDWDYQEDYWASSAHQDEPEHEAEPRPEEEPEEVEESEEEEEEEEDVPPPMPPPAKPPPAPKKGPTPSASNLKVEPLVRARKREPAEPSTPPPEKLLRAARERAAKDPAPKETRGKQKEDRDREKDRDRDRDREKDRDRDRDERSRDKDRDRGRDKERDKRREEDQKSPSRETKKQRVDRTKVVEISVCFPNGALDVQTWEGHTSISTVVKHVSSFARGLEPDDDVRIVYQHFVEEQALKSHHMSLRLSELGQARLSWEVRYAATSSARTPAQAASAESCTATGTSDAEVMIDSGASETVCSPESLARLCKGLKDATGVTPVTQVVRSNQQFRLADGSVRPACSEVLVATPLGNMRIFVLPRTTADKAGAPSNGGPILLGARALKALSAILHYPSGVMEFKTGEGQYKRTLRQTARGHLMLDVSDAVTGRIETERIDKIQETGGGTPEVN